MEVFTWPLFVLVRRRSTIVTYYARGMVCYYLIYTGSQKELLTSKNNSLFRNFSAQNEDMPYKPHNKKVYLY